MTPTVSLPCPVPELLIRQHDEPHPSGAPTPIASTTHTNTTAPQVVHDCNPLTRQHDDAHFRVVPRIAKAQRQLVH